jgi:hypothetical protein
VRDGCQVGAGPTILAQTAGKGRNRPDFLKQSRLPKRAGFAVKFVLDLGLVEMA